jgi:hypothetical protein
MSWQPIETAPRDGTVVLAFAPTEAVVPFITVGWFETEAERWRMLDSCSHMGFRAVQPTHWQPLPEPPKVEK